LSVIGLLQLDSRFPRPIGDVGHPQSWREPLRVEVLRGVGVSDVIRREPIASSTFTRCVTTAQSLVDQGARVITTSCGFFAAIHADLAPRIPVPLVSSSLLWLPALAAQNIPSAQIAVMTFDEFTLGAQHFSGVGAIRPGVVFGLAPHSHLRQCIANNETTLDLQRAQDEVVGYARTLRAQQPDVRVIVLECTNLGPYKKAIAQATGCRVLDIVDAVEQLA
jgi:hypothetical protein